MYVNVNQVFTSDVMPSSAAQLPNGDVLTMCQLLSVSTVEELFVL